MSEHVVIFILFRGSGGMISFFHIFPLQVDEHVHVDLVVSTVNAKNDRKLDLANRKFIYYYS